jgi:hypothetical protein
VALVRKPSDSAFDHLEQAIPFRVIDDTGRPGLVDFRGTWQAA